MKDTIFILISIILGFFLGNFIVYFFNRIPMSWVADYNEVKDENERKYLKSIPWKYVLSGLFICSLIYLSYKYDMIYSVLTVFSLAILVTVSICDIKYRIVPDELIVLLLVTGIGYIKYHTISDMLWGLLVGFLIGLSILLLSKLIFKKKGLGGGDIKLYSTLGFLLGIRGIIFTFLLTTIISGLTFLIEIILKRTSFKDEKPLVPFIALAFSIYEFGAYEILSKVILKI